MMKPIHILLVAMLIFLVGCETKVIMPSDKENLDALTVQGEAELSIEPDKVELVVRIDSEGSTATEAESANRDYASNVVDALKKGGIAANDIETQSYSLQPRYRWLEKEGKSVIDGYSASHTFKVTSTDLKGIGKVLDKAVSAGTTNVDAITFGLTAEKREEVQLRVLALAAKNAQEKAKAIADELDISLKKIRSLTESATVFAPPPYYPRFALAKGAEEASTPIAAQTLEIKATVNAVYEIR